jgi:hypothetical protein
MFAPTTIESPKSSERPDVVTVNDPALPVDRSTGTDHAAPVTPVSTPVASRMTTGATPPAVLEVNFNDTDALPSEKVRAVGELTVPADQSVRALTPVVFVIVPAVIAA